MYIYNLIKKKIHTNGFFYFVYTPCATFIAVSGLLLLCYPEAATEGVKKGISVCIDTLIPTLFPFMLLSQLAIEMKMFNIRSKFLTKITEYIFGFPVNALPIIILSFIGGFPLGAMLISSAYEKGEITLSQGQRMLLFCVNPGPSFALSTVGYAMYGSKKIGIIVYASSVLSSLLIGLLSRFFCDNEAYTELITSEKRTFRFSSALSESVNSSVKGIVNICVWVIVFSCISELTQVFGLTENMSDFIRMITEVTNGVYCAAYDYDLPVVCAVIGFAGFCLHIQVLPSIIRLRLRYRYFLVARIISAAFNCIICYLLLDLFPQNITTAIVGEKAEAVAVASSVPLCIFLMLFCGLFIAGEGINTAHKEKIKKGYYANRTHLY